jgi:hypothetical protein
MRGADPDRIRQLGALLRLRRAAIGYRHVPAFVRARGVNTRMAGDIEHGRRDTYTLPTLQDVAAAYEVTVDSMMAVVWADADELVPAPPSVPAAPAVLPVPGWPPAWMADDEARSAANRPYAERIQGRLDLLALQGNISPSGADLFGEGTRDALDWDKYADFGIRDRVGIVADLQRREVGRGPNSGTGSASA